MEIKRQTAREAYTHPGPFHPNIHFSQWILLILGGQRDPQNGVFWTDLRRRNEAFSSAPGKATFKIMLPTEGKKQISKKGKKISKHTYEKRNGDKE